MPTKNKKLSAEEVISMTTGAMNKGAEQLGGCGTVPAGQTQEEKLAQFRASIHQLIKNPDRKGSFNVEKINLDGGEINISPLTVDQSMAVVSGLDLGDLGFAEYFLQDTPVTTVMLEMSTGLFRDEFGNLSNEFLKQIAQKVVTANPTIAQTIARFKKIGQDVMERVSRE